MSLDTAINESGLSEKNEFLSSDPNLKEEYESNNRVFREFFNTLTGKISAYPTFGNGSIFDYFDPRYENYKYVLAVKTEKFLIHLYDARLDEKGVHGYAQMLVNISEKSFKAKKTGKPYLILSFSDFYILNDGNFKSGWSDDTGINGYYSTSSDYINLEKLYFKKKMINI